MLKVNTKFGDIFIDEAPATDGKVRIYDSERRYMSYTEAETIEGFAEANKTSFLEEVQSLASAFKACESIDDLINNIIFKWDLISADWKSVADHLNKVACETVYKTPESLLTNEYVNKVGDYYIVVSEG